MPNPSGNYSRIKTWGTSDTVLASDLNAEFDNVLNNFNPEMLAAYSQNVSQMQIQTNPGAVGSESLATSIAGELERLRFQINAITGNTYWYSAPAATIAQLNSLISASAFGNRITSGTTSGTPGSTMPAFLSAAGGSSQVLTLKATSVPFNYQIKGSSYVVSADTTVSGLTLAPSTQNTATVTDLTLPQSVTASTQLLGENGSQITVSSAGTNITNLKGSYAAFKTTAGEYLIGYVESSTQITQAFRGYFYNSSGNAVTRGTLANSDTLTLMKLTWVFINTGGTLSVAYTNPKAGGLAPTSPAVNDYWLDTSVNIWKQYSGTVWTDVNSTLIGVCIQDTSGCVASRSFDFFASYADTNNCELFADSQNSGTTVRSRMLDSQVSVGGTLISYAKSEVIWDFSANMDTGTQAASTQYYFYIDPNGKPWISLTAPYDRRGDLRGYYHPNRPWRCLGYGWSNALTLLDNVESFFRGDDCTPVSNITAANNPIILPYNIVQREQVITLTGAAGAFTQVLPPPQQLRGKFLTFIRTDNNIGTAVTIQSWGTAAANPTGTVSATTTPTKITGLSSVTGLSAGQLITAPGIPPNTTLVALEGSTAATMSAATTISITNNTFSFANAASYSGTVGQQTNYANYGINGFFSLPLYMQGEALTVTSDGFAYFVIQHYIPATEYAAGGISVTATTTAPSKGSPSYDTFFWRRVGGNCHFRYDLKTSGGTAGSGDYLFNLPTGLTFDTNRVQTNNTVIGASHPTTFTTIGNGFMTTSAGPTSAYLYAYARTSSAFGMDLTSQGVLGSGVANFAATFEFSVQGSFPVTGWYQL